MSADTLYEQDLRAWAAQTADLLEQAYQPAYRSSSWRDSILEQRLRIRDLLDDCPSLAPFLAQAVERAYPDGVTLAAKETGLPRAQLPNRYPYSLDVLLDDDLFPSPSSRADPQCPGQ